MTGSRRDDGAGIYRRLRRAIDAIDGALVLVGAAMLFCLMCLVVSDVALRYLFNAPLQWSYEVISSYLMPGTFFLAVSHTLRVHSHVAVDILHNYVKTRTRYVFEFVTTILAIPAFAICAVLAAGVTWNDFHAGNVSSSGLALPSWSVSIFLPVGFGLLALRLLLNAIGYGITLASGRPLLGLPPISGTQEGAE